MGTRDERFTSLTAFYLAGYMLYLYGEIYVIENGIETKIISIVERKQITNMFKILKNNKFYFILEQKTNLNVWYILIFIIENTYTNNIKK